MTPKTQSVCKWCDKPEDHAVHGKFANSWQHPFEPVAEPASTGEPKVFCTICGVESGIKHGHAGHTFQPPAARPSEPSAPRIEKRLITHACLNGGEPYKIKPFEIEVEVDAAPQTSAECAACHVVIMPQGTGWIDKHGKTSCGISVHWPAPQPVSGDAPKVEEALKEFIATYARLNGMREQLATAKYDRYVEGASDFAEALRPYFPPASQTPRGYWPVNVSAETEQSLKKLLDRNRDGSEEYKVCAQLLGDIHYSNLATPASTARTDGWVSVEERLPDDDDGYVDVAVDTKAMQDYAEELPDLEMMPVDVANVLFLKAWAGKFITHWQKRPAAPGSVPQGCSCEPGNHANATECHNLGAKDCVGVPQAEPPKEEKP